MSRTGGVGVWLTSVTALLLIGGGCPRSSNQGATGPGGVDRIDAGVATTPPVDAGVDGGGPAVDPGLALAPGCAVIPCVYYPGTDTYYRCLSSGAGRCFHYGGPCNPEGGCMFDHATRGYRSCAQPSEGRCPKFGPACRPVSDCRFAPEDALYRICEELTGGRCARFGATCEP